MPFSFSPGPLPGLVIIEPRLFPDERGFFQETYKESAFREAGLPMAFVQDNHSRSSRGTVRGLHFQRSPHAQGKLVRVVRGAVWDVAVDIRVGSPQFGRWAGIELSAANRLEFYIPEGFAHGFVALEDDTELLYRCTAEYHMASEGGIRWDDPDLAIDWPIRDGKVSARDASMPSFAAYRRSVDEGSS